MLAAFVLLCAPDASKNPRLQRLARGALIGGGAATVAAILVQGPYTAGVSMARVLDTKLLRQTLEKHRPMVVVEVSTPPAGTIASLDHLKGLFPANYEFFVLVEDQSQFVSGKYKVEEFAPRAAEFFRAGGQRNLVAVPAEHAAKTPRRRE